MKNEEIIQQKMRAGLNREQAEAVVAADEKSRRDAIRREAALSPQFIAFAERNLEEARELLAKVQIQAEAKQKALEELEALEAAEAGPVEEAPAEGAAKGKKGKKAE